MATKAQLETEIMRLKMALFHYTDATIVSSWGCQELGDAGELARMTLGYGNHVTKKSWNDTETEPCAWPDGDCTCGLQKRIDDDAEMYAEGV